MSQRHAYEKSHLNEAFRSWSGSPWMVGPGMMTGGPVQLGHNPVSPVSLPSSMAPSLVGLTTGCTGCHIREAFALGVSR